MKLRGHNLLCIQGFVGKGYSPGFVENLARLVASLDARTEVTVVDEPDLVCRACPHLTPRGCALHGEGAEGDILRQDRAVLARLGLEAGATLRWEEVRERIRRAVAPDDLDAICGCCPWLPLGHCREGLRRLREACPMPGPGSVSE